MEGQARVDDLLDAWTGAEGAELQEALAEAYGTGADMDCGSLVRLLFERPGSITVLRRNHLARIDRAALHLDTAAVRASVLGMFDRLLGRPAADDADKGHAFFTAAVDFMTAQGVVKDGVNVHSRIRVDDVPIPAYEFKCTLRAFVYNMGSSPDMPLFEGAHKSKSVLEDLYKKLLHMTENIPSLCTSRHHHAWRNGMVDVNTGDLTPFDDLDADIVACVYHDQPYNPIPNTPHFDSILHMQGINNAIELLFLALAVGRMLHSPADDNWQRLIYVFGTAGTGKSLMLNVISDLVGRSIDISSDAEPRWIGGQLHNMHLMTCGDMTSKCSWPKSLLLTLTGNRTFQMERKYMDPATTICTSHMLLAGNGPLPFTDIAGEMDRRVVPFSFSTPVVQIPSLGNSLVAEYPSIFKKACEAYTEISEWMEDEGVDLDDLLKGCGAAHACQCSKCSYRQGPYFMQGLNAAIDHS